MDIRYYIRKEGGGMPPIEQNSFVLNAKFLEVMPYGTCYYNEAHSMNFWDKETLSHFFFLKEEKEANPYKLLLDEEIFEFIKTHISFAKHQSLEIQQIGNNGKFCNSSDGEIRNSLEILILLLQFKEIKLAKRVLDIDETITLTHLKMIEAYYSCALNPEGRFILSFLHSHIKKMKAIRKKEARIQKAIDLDGTKEAFMEACRSGALEKAKEHYKKLKSLSIPTNNDRAFEHACRNGHLELAKWLWELDEMKNPAAVCKIAEQLALEKEHFNVVRWLRYEK